MAVKTAYISRLGRDYKVSPHFTLGEIASKDGADKVLYSEELLEKLEELRAILGGDEADAKITTNSFYRSPAHNKKVGGASNSTHTKGYAADIKAPKGGEYISAKLLCCLCQDMGFRGVAYIDETSVHLDMYDRTYRGDERKGYRGNVGGDFYSYFKITKAQVEALKVKTEEEDDMTKEEVKSIVYEVLAEYMGKKAVEAPSPWSEEARKWAKGSDIITGTNIGDEWKSPVNREQLATIIYRVMQKIDPIR